jgi:hypothetical protein
MCQVCCISDDNCNIRVAHVIMSPLLCQLYNFSIFFLQSNLLTHGANTLEDHFSGVPFLRVIALADSVTKCGCSDRALLLFEGRSFRRELLLQRSSAVRRDVHFLDRIGFFLLLRCCTEVQSTMFSAIVPRKQGFLFHTCVLCIPCSTCIS